METLISNVLFSFVDPPNVRVSLPRWVQLPSAMQMFGLFLGMYFLVTAGVVYDVINEPPSIGSYVDERGNQRPQAIMPHRINGQYIMEGLVASAMFSLTAIGIIILDKANTANVSRNNRIVLLALGFGCAAIGFFTTRLFITIKMPGYLH
ncbi:Oligosaccharyltransferase complex subunit [Aphelenchoides besseyi]|nr:Oligosaccharyltransferase complex subunit [Aphelenchoides besseyi]KAI6207578.1 Oligosaccharyltransferase complex subunit [Aphelenchoides besseyi]